MNVLSVSWTNCTATLSYRVHDIYYSSATTSLAGGAKTGLTWHLCRPPVFGLEYEMDCRAVRTERVIDPPEAWPRYLLRSCAGYDRHAE